MNQMTEAGQFKPDDKPSRAVAWTTDDEIEFISRIGASLWPQNLPRPRELRKSVLIGQYLAGIARRGKWGAIDAIRVIEYARKRMAYEAQVEKEEDEKWRH